MHCIAGMAHTNTATNPGTPNAKAGYKASSNQTVLNAGTGSNWGTMVTVNGKAYQVASVHTNGNGNTTAYTVTTRANLNATVPATACGTPYLGYCVSGNHWGACKLATAMGLVNGLNRYAQ